MSMMQKTERKFHKEGIAAKLSWIRMFASMLAILIIAGALAACSSKPAGDASSATPSSSTDSATTGKKTIRFVVLEYSDQTLKLFQQVADDYMKEHPDMDVKLENLSWDTAHDKFVSWNSTGQVPDGAMIGPKWIPEFRDLGVIEPFDKYVDKTFLDNFSPSLLQPLTIDNQLWALPEALSTRMMFYRKDLLEQAGLSVPKTWDEFTHAAQVLNKPSEQNGFVIQASDDETIWYYNYFLFGAGGSFVGPDGKFKVDAPANVEALQYEVDLINKYKVTPPNPTAASRDTVEKTFSDGKAAFYWGPPWTLARIERENPDLVKNIGVTNYPTKSGQPAPMYIQDSFALFKGSKYKQETVDFIKFWLQDKYHVAFAKAEGVLPVTISGGKDPFWANSPIYSQFISSLPDAKTYPIIANWEAANVEVRQAVQAAILGTPPQKALSDAQARIDAAAGRAGR